MGIRFRGVSQSSLHLHYRDNTPVFPIGKTKKRSRQTRFRRKMNRLKKRRKKKFLSKNLKDERNGKYQYDKDSKSFIFKNIHELNKYKHRQFKNEQQKKRQKIKEYKYKGLSKKTIRRRLRESNKNNQSKRAKRRHKKIKDKNGKVIICSFSHPRDKFGNSQNIQTSKHYIKH